MKRSTGIGICLLVLSLSVLVRAEDKPVLAWIEYIKVKPGTEAQFEAALQKHFAWHRQQNDTWPIFIWQVVTGERAGQYVFGTFKNTWKDYDAREAFEKVDMKEAMAALGPYVESYTPSIWAYQEESSRSPDGTEPSKFVQLTHCHLKPTAVSAFTDALKEIKAALDAEAFPVRNSWYALVSGGEVPYWVNAVPPIELGRFRRPREDHDEDAGGEAGRPQGDGAGRHRAGRLQLHHDRDHRLPVRPQLHPGQAIGGASGRRTAAISIPMAPGAILPGAFEFLGPPAHP